MHEQTPKCRGPDEHGSGGHRITVTYDDTGRPGVLKLPRGLGQGLGAGVAAGDTTGELFALPCRFRSPLAAQAAADTLPSLPFRSSKGLVVQASWGAGVATPMPRRGGVHADSTTGSVQALGA